MTLFIALAAALTVLIIVWMVWPLLRPTPLNNVSSLRLNAAIYREQLDALERDLANGAMTSCNCACWTTPQNPMPLPHQPPHPSGAHDALRYCWPWYCPWAPQACTTFWATLQH